MRPMLTAVPGVWARAQKLGVALQRLMKRAVWLMAMVTTVAAVVEAEAPQVRQGRRERQRERGQEASVARGSQVQNPLHWTAEDTVAL